MVKVDLLVDDECETLARSTGAARDRPGAASEALEHLTMRKQEQVVTLRRALGHIER